MPWPSSALPVNTVTCRRRRCGSRRRACGVLPRLPGSVGRALGGGLRAQAHAPVAARSRRSARRSRPDTAPRDGNAAARPVMIASAVRRGGCLHQRGGAADCAQDAHVRAAAAEIGLHVRGGSRRRSAPGCARSSACARMIMPGDAIAALRRLLVDEGLLQRAGIVRRARAPRAS